MRLRFGRFLFDSGRRELRAGSETVHLTPKSFLLLEALLNARPSAVSREFLYERLWPGTFVGDTNLKMLVSVLRVALGEDARNPRWIKTVYGYGYAFDSDEVVELPPGDDGGSPQVICRLLLAGEAFPLKHGANVLGRGDDADVVIDDPSVSRHHAVIIIRGEGAVIEDLESKNGTFVGSQRIGDPAELRDGDRITLGSAQLTFTAQPRAISTVTHVRR